MDRFRDRRHAGGLLARALASYAGSSDVVVLALPRGGVPVGYELAQRLGAPLDVLVVRKLGVPDYEEFAMGAIASGGIQVVDRRITHQLGVSNGALRATIAREHRELERAERAFRGERALVDVAGKIGILVDDGLATGSSMIAAIEALRLLRPARMVVAAPVATPRVVDDLRWHVDDVACLLAPDDMRAVADWYDDFPQIADADVRELLDDNRLRVAPAEGRAGAQQTHPS
jgi:putative phosphoribosyl transferase